MASSSAAALASGQPLNASPNINQGSFESARPDISGDRSWTPTLSRGSPTKRARNAPSASPAGVPSQYGPASPARRHSRHANASSGDALGSPSNDQENLPALHHEQVARGRATSPSPISSSQNPSDYRGVELHSDDRSRHRRVSPSKALLQKLRRSPSPKRRSVVSAGDRKSVDASVYALPNNAAQTHKRTSSAAPPTPDVGAEFEQLLDTLEVPAPLRSKLVALDAGVKASMLKGNATLNLSSFGLDPKRRSQVLASGTGGVLSSNMYGILSPQAGVNAGQSTPQDVFSGVSTSNLFSPVMPSAPLGPGQDVGATKRHSGSFNMQASSSARSLATGSSSAVSCATTLRCAPAPSLDVSRVKRIRAAIACETPVWINDFCNAGGYVALCERLEELLQMEWREEQHDDHLLHELLRCFVAFGTTERGKAALVSRAPAPFAQLCSLLWSEKKPGDLTTRRYLVEVLLMLPDLDLGKVQALPPREGSSLHVCAHHRPGLQLLLSLVHNEPNPTVETIVHFVRAGHAARPFKAWMSELSGVCRDYFWIFCHSQNRFWHLPDVDQKSAAGPKVPGGMTGGVEFEAMGYLTTQFRVINRIGAELSVHGRRHSDHTIPPPALEFHQLLFASGIERVIATLRKASQTYYTPMHLELARYISLSDAVGMTMPPSIDTWRPTAAPAPSLERQIRNADYGSWLNMNTPSPQGTPTKPTKAPDHKSPALAASRPPNSNFKAVAVNQRAAVPSDVIRPTQQRRGSVESVGVGVARSPPGSPDRNPIVLAPSTSPTPNFGSFLQPEEAGTSDTTTMTTRDAALVKRVSDMTSLYPPLVEGERLPNPHPSPDPSGDSNDVGSTGTRTASEPSSSLPSTEVHQPGQAIGFGPLGWELVDNPRAQQQTLPQGLRPGAADSFVGSAIRQWEQRRDA
ncbi:hypothetical protein CBOM_00915 [Ceraceosorus bombacis]|uniref:Formin GTPase-binding domain-containing protein n=1 Tax=Ceraceosorus bombacis TaxID=401625 RepID=A0A0P1BB21_9BASI|nr:hypothetical protein CBOM_00915 [Ceraceosorus bombacis]